jgi:hypothetical protein
MEYAASKNPRIIQNSGPNMARESARSTPRFEAAGCDKFVTTGEGTSL